MVRTSHTFVLGFVVACSLPALAGCGDDSGRSAGAGHENVGSTAEALTVKCGASMSGAVQGRDVSVYQGAFDWAGAKAGGVSFGYARVSDGSTILDPTFAGNWASMKNAGILRGAYQFFEPGEDEVAQANLFVQKVGKLGDGDLPPLVDVESSGGQAPATTAAKLKHWLKLVEAGTGKRPWIYTGAYFWQDNVGDTTFGQYPLWIAAYGPVCPSIPDGWSNWTVWQYGDGNGTLDHDVFNGGLATLQAFARSDGASGFPPIARRSATDVNGDGASDICGRSSAGVICELGTKGAAAFTTITGPEWSDAKGWKDPSSATTVQLADVNGDGKSDICGRSAGGFICQLSNGTGFPTTIAGPPWSDAQGWNSAPYYSTIQLADVNGDGKVDACARGWAGIECYLSDGKGFPTKITGPAWSDPAGWDAPQYYSTIQYADVNGDGKDDVCGRSAAGVTCYLSDGTGFPTRVNGPAWSDASGWAAPATGSTLRFVDINGDKKADLCARASDGIHCMLSNGTGFGADIKGPAFSDAKGWAKPQYYDTILYADIDGDGRSDVCGRSAAGMECSLFDGAAFGPLITGPAWSDTLGWNKPQQYTTIGAADVNHDGKDDLCGRAAAGMFCALSNGHGFDAPFAGPAWSDASGWGAAPYFGSIRYAGNPSASPEAPHPGGTGGDTAPGAAGPGSSRGAPSSETTEDPPAPSSGGCALTGNALTSDARTGGTRGGLALLVALVSLAAGRRRRRRGALTSLP